MLLCLHPKIKKVEAKYEIYGLWDSNYQDYGLWDVTLCSLVDGCKNQ